MSKVFQHKPVSVPKLRQINSETGRKYLIEEQGISYPSITTLLGATQDKSALYAWRKRVGEEKANAISRNATTRGTSMHNLCENYLKNETLDSLGSPSGSFMFKSLIPDLDLIDNVRCLETPLFSHKFKVCGTVDCIAEYEGKLSVIDFKTASKPKKLQWIQNYFMQGCFYFWSYFELTGEMPEQILILISVEDGSVQRFVLEQDEIKKYSIELKKAVTQYYNTIGE